MSDLAIGSGAFAAAAPVARAVEDYNMDVVRKFTSAAMFWAIVAFLVGVLLAAQLAFPIMNLGFEFTAFGRLRPVHTSAAIFAFGGSALFATSFYIVQRTCRARLFGGEALHELVVKKVLVAHRRGGLRTEEVAEFPRLRPLGGGFGMGGEFLFKLGQRGAGELAIDPGGEALFKGFHRRL